MMFNGSRHYKRGELIPAMQKLGLDFGGDVNAYTGMENTVYMMDLPDLKDETVDFASRPCVISATVPCWRMTLSTMSAASL